MLRQDRISIIKTEVSLPEVCDISGNPHVPICDLNMTGVTAIVLSCMTLCICLLGCGDGKSIPTSPRDVPTEQQASQSRITFHDMTSASEVNSIYRTGREAGVYSIVESLGGGTGVFDYDHDGNVDLFFTGGGSLANAKVTGHPHRFFRNRPGTVFQEVSDVADISTARTYSQGCSMGDYDCDGFVDVIVTGFEGLQLFHNDGDGTFSEVHQSAQLNDALWSSSAAWGDLNRDGFPDLYIAHYVDWTFENDPECPSPWPEHEQDVCPPRVFSPLPDVVYFNDGNGAFRDGSKEANLRLDGKGLGVLIADLNHDTFPDVYVANDMVDNFLYQNDGSGRFEETGLLSGTAGDFEGRPNGSMGLAVCDYNGDLLPDLWVTNFEQETFALYRNDGDAGFVHASRETGITAIGQLFVGFGTAMGDLDCDGDEDAVISNGHVVYYPTVSAERQLPLLLQNYGEGRFVRDNSAPPDNYFSTPHAGRGLAIADVNNDGRLDIIAGHTNEPAAVLANISSIVGSWIRFHLIGTKSSRDAVGARVVLTTFGGQQLRHLSGGGSFQSQHDTRLHFGIPRDAKNMSATVYWPSGRVQKVDKIAAEQTNFIVEN